MDPYATHQRLLIRYALKCNGNIAETGCGYYSTPLLKEIAKYKGVKLISYVSDAAWAEKFRNLTEANVYEQRIVDFTKPFDIEPCGMVFVDHEQVTTERVKHLDNLFKFTNYVVIHDSDRTPSQLKRYNIIEVDASFLPNTCVLKK
jgi:hypothetical protein